MKRIIKYIFPFLFVSSCISPNVAVNKNANFSKIKRVAVLTFQGQAGASASDIFTTTLLKYGADVVERQQIDTIIKELNLSQSDIISPQNRKKVGNLLSVDAIITGSITTFKPNTKYLIKNSSSFAPVKEIKGKNVYLRSFDSSQDASLLETTAEVGLSIRMVDVETGSILFSGYMNWEALDVESGFQTISEYIINSLSRYWKELKHN